VFWVAVVQGAQGLPELLSLWAAALEEMGHLQLFWRQQVVLILAMVEEVGRLRKIKARTVGLVLLYCRISPIIREDAAQSLFLKERLI
jgi:hypothetical protein